MLRGRCLCGGVAFVLEREPLWAHYCHCSRCRKSTGSAFATPLIVPADALRFEKGAELVRRFELPGSTYAANFCSRCGSPVPAVEPTPGEPLRGIPLGTLEDDPGRRPLGHIYVGSKAPWHAITDELPQFDEMPPPDVQADLLRSS